MLIYVTEPQSTQCMYAIQVNDKECALYIQLAVLPYLIGAKEVGGSNNEKNSLSPAGWSLGVRMWPFSAALQLASPLGITRVI